MRRARSALAALSVALTVPLAACAQEAKESGSPPEEPAAAEPAAESAAATASASADRVATGQFWQPPSRRATDGPTVDLPDRLGRGG